MNTREFIDKWLNHKLKPIPISVGKYHHITCNAYHLWHYHTCIARWWTLNNGKKVLFINNTNYGHWSDIIQAHLIMRCKEMNIIYFVLDHIPIDSFYMHDQIEEFIKQYPGNINTL